MSSLMYPACHCGKGGSKSRWQKAHSVHIAIALIVARGPMAPKKKVGLTGGSVTVPAPAWAKWRLNKEELKLVTPAEIGVRVCTFAQ